MINSFGIRWRKENNLKKYKSVKSWKTERQLVKDPYSLMSWVLSLNKVNLLSCRWNVNVKLKIGEKFALGFLCTSISITISLEFGDFEVEMSEIFKEEINTNLSLTQTRTGREFCC